MVRMSSQIVVNERVKNKAVTQFCSLHLLTSSLKKHVFYN